MKLSGATVWTAGAPCAILATVHNVSSHRRRRPAATLHLAPVDPPEAIRHGNGLVGPRLIRVLVADTHALVRAGLGSLLDHEDDLRVVADAANAEQAVVLSRRLRPDALVVDAALPPRGGVDVARALAAEAALSGMSIVMVTSSEHDDCILDALRVGVRGFLLRDADASELGDAVRTVARGGGILSPAVARRLIDEFAALPDLNCPRPARFDELTRREVEVVALVARGLSNREIAERLVVTPETAKTHVSRALRKVDARDRAQLVTFAYEAGLVVPTRTIAPAVLGVA
jgi:DNA-binding NarL/FixJ family response regulator